MTYPLYLQKGWLLLHQHKVPITAGLTALALTLPFLFAPVRQLAKHQLSSLLGSSDSPPALSVTFSPLPPDTPLVRIEERAKELERQVVELQQLRLNDLAEIRSLRSQFQEAVGEVAQANDIMEQQAEQLRVALRGLSSGAPNISGTTEESGDVSSTASGKININTATTAQLDELPGIGPSYAQRIVEYRTQNGPFKKVDDLDKVEGIGPSTLEKIRELIEV